jgi:hypothetical protein
MQSNYRIIIQNLVPYLYTINPTAQASNHESDALYTKTFVKEKCTVLLHISQVEIYPWFHSQLLQQPLHMVSL